MLKPAMTNCLVYLVLSSLLLSSVSAKVFVSIDCGSSLSSYTDKHGIEWVGDNNYTKNGETHKVGLSSTMPGGWDASHVMSTLRVFTTRKKNCYSIEAEKGERVLIRPSFFYGNYDNKSSPPTFNMHVDGNNWATVVTTSMNTFIYYEAAYTVKGNSISICLAQTKPDQFPFISSLEVRSFDAGMYSYIDSKYPLYFGWKLAFGATNITRYPDDAYDRIWHPVILDGENRVTSDSPSISLDDAVDNPPLSVIRMAATPSNISERVLSLTGDSSGFFSPLYFNLYFSEVSKLNATQERSFHINVNNETVNNGSAVTPPYGRALELQITNVTSSNNTIIELVRTSNSTLPPIFNALEMFNVGDKQTEGTDPIDVKSLAVLQKSFIQLRDWSGDPCLPSPFTWDWVGCSSSNDNPRITALYLSDLGLVGALPDFSGLDALETIDLHNNSLAQEFPDFFGSFPVLKKLNVANNNFSGTVPPTLLSENEDLSLNITGNPHLCLSDKSCETGAGRPLPTTPQPSGNSKLKTTNMLPIVLFIGTVIPILLDVFSWVIVF